MQNIFYEEHAAMTLSKIFNASLETYLLANESVAFHCNTIISQQHATKRSTRQSLTNNVDQVEEFAEEEPERIPLVVVPVDGEVVGEQLDPVLLGVSINGWDVHVLDQHLDLAALPGLPEVAGDIEKECLEEECEADPLVVLVVADLLAFLEIGRGRHAGVSDVVALAAVDRGRDRERRVDPAVRVHDIVRDFLEVD